MKLKHSISIILITLITLTYADTITVKQDGTGDYTIIQYAINASFDGDTVLVYPGTYFENIDFAGHSITLASLVITTGDINYKFTTIIDGDSSGSCVRVSSNEVSSLFGFTLQKGSGTEFADPHLYFGGGVYIEDASLDIINCIIKDNFANYAGGGINCFFGGSCFLSGTSIFNNHALLGGGLVYGFEGFVELDSVNRCNIYSNFASWGGDLWKRNDNPFTVYLDTCTVLNPDRSFLASVDEYQYPVDDLTIIINNSLLTPVDSDLYVNPGIGDNNNSGLSPEEPLKTISYAYSLILPDSIERNTIYLANGVYSDSSNSEKFPLNIRGFVNVVGDNMDYTILDAKHKSPILKGNRQTVSYEFRNMSLSQGGKVFPIINYTGLTRAALLYGQNDNVTFDSVRVEYGGGYKSNGAFSPQSCNNLVVSNCEFINNTGIAAISMGVGHDDTTYFINNKIINNQPDYLQDPPGGKAMNILGYPSTVVMGCLFQGNFNENLLTIGVNDPSAAKNIFINCTFTDNVKSENKRSLNFWDSSAELINCIVYDEGTTKPISLGWVEKQDTTILSIYNSLIENGVESIELETPYGTLIYDDTNIEGDPLFYYGPDFPYNLSDYSPCIDAGTLDIPEWIELPEFDLAGNPRVYGETIDMGAYEWNPTVGIEEYEDVEKEEELLKIAPNPFSTSTTITAINKDRAKLKVEVYNNTGQRVKQLINAMLLPQTANMIWDGTDHNGTICPTGVYYIVMVVNDRVVKEIKVIKQ